MARQTAKYNKENRAVKFLAFFRAVAFRAPAHHDNRLRAGDFPKAPIFTPWTMLVS